MRSGVMPSAGMRKSHFERGASHFGRKRTERGRTRKGSAIHVMLALRRCSRQVVVTNEKFNGPDMVGELLGKR
jgi:hypothetical protein